MKKILLLLLLIIPLYGCSNDLGKQHFKAPKEKIIEHRLITIYVQSETLGAKATSTPLIAKQIVSYDYVSDIKVDEEFIFRNSKYSNERVYSDDTKDYFAGDQVYLENGDVFKIISGATTTIELFDEYTKITWFDRLFKKAIASDDYTSTISTSKGIYVASTSWDTAHDATTGNLVVQAVNGKGTFVGTQKSGATFYVMRYDWAFDTSGIPDGDPISAVEVWMNGNADSGDSDSSVCILLNNTDNGNLNHPLQSEDMNDFGSTSIGSETYDVLKADAEHAITITNFDFINDTGNSYLGTRNSNDIADTPVTGFARIYLDLGSSGSDPFLRITIAVPVTEPVYPSAGIIMIE